MSNLLARLLTAVVTVPLLILGINWANPLAVELIVLFAAVVGLREWMGMALKSAPTADKIFGVLAGTALLTLTIFFGERPMLVPAATAGVTMLVFLYYLFRHDHIDTVAARIASTMTGFFYVGLVVFLALEKRQPHGGTWIYVSLCIAWLSDTGAYFAGRFLGPIFPRKLYESVSPKKTVVGFCGGIIASYLSVVFIKLVLFPSLTWVDTVLVAVPANLFGQMGDLCESLIKRSVGVKDSGALLPGHGGMLDRIDAVLFVAPYVYVYSRWVYGAG